MNLSLTAPLHRRSRTAAHPVSTPAAPTSAPAVSAPAATVRRRTTLLIITPQGGHSAVFAVHAHR